VALPGDALERVRREREASRRAVGDDEQRRGRPADQRDERRELIGGDLGRRQGAPRIDDDEAQAVAAQSCRRAADDVLAGTRADDDEPLEIDARAVSGTGVERARRIEPQRMAALVLRARDRAQRERELAGAPLPTKASGAPDWMPPARRSNDVPVRNRRSLAWRSDTLPRRTARVPKRRSIRSIAPSRSAREARLAAITATSCSPVRCPRVCSCLVRLVRLCASVRSCQPGPPVRTYVRR